MVSPPSADVRARTVVTKPNDSLGAACRTAVFCAMMPRALVVPCSKSFRVEMIVRAVYLVSAASPASCASCLLEEDSRTATRPPVAQMANTSAGRASSRPGLCAHDQAPLVFCCSVLLSHDDRHSGMLLVKTHECSQPGETWQAGTVSWAACLFP
jgi:hypothetical protein